jgi:ribonuclease HI
MVLADGVGSELVAVEKRLEELLGQDATTGQNRATSLEIAAAPPSSRSRSDQPVQGVLPEPAPVVPSRPGGESAPPVSSTPPAVATVFTDGSAEGNPGPGGYCAIVRVPGLPDRELSGGTNHTTNNKMELTAAIVGVRAALDAGARRVTVVSDSEYLVKGMTRWLAGWLAKGWRTSDGQPVKNRELWEQLAELAKRGTLRWQWIRGHAGHPENERCDAVATAAARQAATSV